MQLTYKCHCAYKLLTLKYSFLPPSLKYILLLSLKYSCVFFCFFLHTFFGLLSAYTHFYWELYHMIKFLGPWQPLLSSPGSLPSIYHSALNSNLKLFPSCLWSYFSQFPGSCVQPGLSQMIYSYPLANILHSLNQTYLLNIVIIHEYSIYILCFICLPPKYPHL